MKDIKIISNGKPVKVDNNPPKKEGVSRVQRKFLEKYKPEELTTLPQQKKGSTAEATD